MSKTDPEQVQTSLPLYADPACGALIGTFLLAACLAPVGLGIALVAWIVMEAYRRAQHRDEGLSSQGEPAVDEFAARFQELESDILRDDGPGGPA